MVVGGSLRVRLASCAAKLWSSSLIIMEAAAISLARDLTVSPVKLKSSSVGFIS
jgi:hypothetical protein